MRCPAWLAQALIELGLDLDPPAAWVAVRWGGALSMAAGLLLVGPLFALLGGAVLAGGPAAVRRVLARRAADRRDAQLPQALERLASNLRAGSALGPAFVATAQAVPPPLGAELRAAAAEVEHGSGLANALEHWRSGPTAGHEVQLAAVALGLAAAAGGEVARSVDRVAATLRERRELHAEARALATQARASAGVLALAPLAFTALVATVEPTAVAFLVTSPVGLLCLVSGLGLEALGALWMGRILRSVA